MLSVAILQPTARRRAGWQHTYGCWLCRSPVPGARSTPVLGAQEGSDKASLPGVKRDGSGQQSPESLPCSFPQIMHNVSLS